jgi:hypothetical protein
VALTPKQNAEVAQALLQALGDKAPPELREALAANPETTRTRAAPRRAAAQAPRAPSRPRPRHHHYHAPRLPREVESAAPLAWLAALLVGGACLLSILGSCENQRAVNTWAIMQQRR